MLIYTYAHTYVHTKAVGGWAPLWMTWPRLEGDSFPLSRRKVGECPFMEKNEATLFKLSSSHSIFLTLLSRSPLLSLYICLTFSVSLVSYSAYSTPAIMKSFPVALHCILCLDKPYDWLRWGQTPAFLGDAELKYRVNTRDEREAHWARLYKHTQRPKLHQVNIIKGDSLSLSHCFSSTPLPLSFLLLLSLWISENVSNVINKDGKNIRGLVYIRKSPIKHLIKTTSEIHRLVRAYQAVVWLILFLLDSL